jgi:hypothetical protein
MEKTAVQLFLRSFLAILTIALTSSGEREMGRGRKRVRKKIVETSTKFLSFIHE